VVAHPRSGSTSLVEILDCHPELTLLDEPFNEDFSSWLPANPDYRARVTDVPSFDRVVDGIVDEYSGFKVHSYQLDPELLAHLLCRTDLYVVFLRRRNLLEAPRGTLGNCRAILCRKYAKRGFSGSSA
jgi:hypothetical protein